MKNEIRKRLEPTHLNEAVSAVETKKELEKQQQEQGQEQVTDDPRLDKQYMFKFNWADGNGKVWAGEFTNKVLSIQERQMVGVMRARLSFGESYAALDDLTRDINLMIAHMSYSLVEKPSWAEDLQALEDIRILQELYQEVLLHEAIFLGYGKNKKSS